jgi:hypothetical protein
MMHLDDKILALNYRKMAWMCKTLKIGLSILDLYIKTRYGIIHKEGNNLLHPH